MRDTPREHGREPGEGALDAATRRLGQALTALEQQVGRKLSEARRESEAASNDARARLSAELDASRAREHALEAIAAEASAALGRAADEVRAALSLDEPGEVEAGDHLEPEIGATLGGADEALAGGTAGEGAVENTVQASDLFTSEKD